jgi:hypothetical protein
MTPLLKKGARFSGCHCKREKSDLQGENEGEQEGEQQGTDLGIGGHRRDSLASKKISLRSQLGKTGEVVRTWPMVE